MVPSFGNFNSFAEKRAKGKREKIAGRAKLQSGGAKGKTIAREKENPRN
jgi:hypothetical protein